MGGADDAEAVARVHAALARLDDVGARTNCVADRDDDAVLAAAASAPAGPLDGEPVTVKDWIDVAGFRCSGGSATHADRRPTEDATAVARLRAAGAVVVAKTAVLVDSERFGAVLHPHDPARSPGGSSSGEAAAVGGGAVRLGIGSDSGGSVRVPAAWCGVVGMKPTTGLVPTTGHFPRIGDRSDGRTVLGPLACSVDLAWRAVRLMAGPDGADGAVAPVPLGDPDEVDVAQLTVAVDHHAVERATPVLADAVGRAVAALERAGVEIVPSPADWLDEARRITEAYWSRFHRTGEQIEQDLFDWDRFRRRVLLATGHLDATIGPTVPAMAPLHREMRTDDYLFCLPASLTGAPAVSVPVGDGAVQVTATRWHDHVAIAVARLLEE